MQWGNRSFHFSVAVLDSWVEMDPRPDAGNNTDGQIDTDSQIHTYRQIDSDRQIDTDRHIDR